ncbi:MAG: C40 family peptidase, partial [Actinobacteria bacterium]|nr:C40 family peptidase [Actinomycetota bacterium]
RGVEAPDIPMLRRYDQVRVTAGTLDGHFVIESISHDQDAAIMTLKLGNLHVVPLAGTFTLLDESAIPPEQTTGGDLGGSGGFGGGSLVSLSGPVSPAQVCALAKMAGFPDPALATAVSMAENRTGDPSAFSSTQDIGLWQVNVPIWGAKFGGQAALTDPVTNAKAAKSILDQQGWGAWTTYRQGLHRPFLDQAAAACAQNVQLPTTQAATSGGQGGGTSRLMAAIQPWMGVPYVFGGTSKSGVDCSGFTQAVFRELGVSIPRVAQAQYDATRRVSLGQEQVGDMVFFSGTYNAGTPVTHVGIVIDPSSKQMAHCGSP